MAKIPAKNIILLVAIIMATLWLSAVANGKISVGGYPIEYDSTLESDTNGNGKNDRTSYYLNGVLTFTAYDENEDGKPDLWLRFKNGDTIDLELADKNGDGEPDLITEITPQEKAEVIYDSGARGESTSVISTLLVLAIIAAAGAYFSRELLVKQLAALKKHINSRSESRS